MTMSTATTRAAPTVVAESAATASGISGVSIVVPCFNESESFGQLVERLDALVGLWKNSFPVEVILVDDGSSDDTHALMLRAAEERSFVRVVQHERNRGIAAAIMTGIHAAWNEVVCTIDADCTYDPRQLTEMLPMLTADVAAVTASPYHPQGKVQNLPAWRLTLSRGASAMYRLIFRQKLHTYTSCFRVLRRDSVCQLKVRDEGFLGVTEILWRIDRGGGRIVEYPALLSVRRYGQSKLRVMSVATSHARFFMQAAWERFTSK